MNDFLFTSKAHFEIAGVICIFQISEFCSNALHGTNVPPQASIIDN